MIKNLELYLAWLVASLGTLIALFFSEVLRYEPCNLCWLQRICLFPLSIILGIAAYKGFHKISIFVLPQVALGLLFALYQVLLQEIPDWNPIEICGAGPSCKEKYYIGLGPITIPMLSALGFFLIGALLFLSGKRNVKKT